MAKLSEVTATEITFQEGSTPATPASTKWKQYFKTDGMYVVDDAGSETGPLGSASAAAYSGAGVKRITSDQSISATTNTAIQWNGEDWDTDTYHDNSTNPSRLTVPDTGYYLVTCTLAVSNLGGEGQFFLHVNGSNVTGGSGVVRESESSTWSMNFSFTLSLTANDYVTVNVYFADAADILYDRSFCHISKLG